jgi:2-furoyl-CoA dehydrogenase 2Fe-2S iron sulfur subunit
MSARHLDISMRVNGEAVSARIEARKTLVDFLRDDLSLTGTHVGCEHGVCGACTVEIDGKLARACLTLAVQADGCALRTVEGLAPAPNRLGILQEAFKRNHALQCGFCTAGILMSLDNFLRENPIASEQQVRDLLTGHLCRCTGYAPIVRAAMEAAGEIAGDIAQEKSDA